MNLSRQIKRHLQAPSHEFFAVTHPGFETVCGDEIKKIAPGATIGEVVHGGVVFSGRLNALYESNLESRTAGRLLMRVAEFKASNFRRLQRNTLALPWAWYLPWGELPGFQVATRRSRLFHSQAVGEQMTDAIRRYWAQFGVSAVPGKQRLWVRIDDDRVMLSLDSSGENLYRRGLKTHPGRAPIRETMAAAILQAAGYRADRPLLDPMCGAGTFALEAALMAKQISPGYFREFAFTRWPAFRSRQWQYLKSRAAERMVTLDHPLIRASDIDNAACGALASCLQRNQLTDAVEVAVGDFFSLDPLQVFHDGASGLVVLNPPYGHRLQPSADLETFYGAIGTRLAKAYKGWQAAVLVPFPGLAAKLPSGFSARTVTHGGQSLLLLTGSIG